MLINDMVPDGEKPSLLVDPAYRDIRHPTRDPIDLSDAQALRRVAPNAEDDSVGGSGESLAEALGYENSFGGET